MYFWKLPSPPSRPPLKLASISCRDPLVGKSGLSSRLRVRPMDTLLWNASGRLKIEPDVPSASSYFVSDSEYPTKTRLQRGSSGNGTPKRNPPPVRRCRPSSKLMNRLP